MIIYVQYCTHYVQVAKASDTAGVEEVSRKFGQVVSVVNHKASQAGNSTIPIMFPFYSSFYGLEAFYIQYLNVYSQSTKWDPSGLYPKLHTKLATCTGTMQCETMGGFQGWTLQLSWWSQRVG